MEGFNSILMGSVSTGSVSYDTDALAYFARMDIQPTTALKDLLNTTIVSMKTNGIWDKLDTFVFMNLNTSFNSRLNIKGDYNNHTWINYQGSNVATTPYSGTTINTSPGTYIHTNYWPSGGTNFTLNDSGIYFSCEVSGNGGDGTYYGGGTMVGFNGYNDVNDLNETNWNTINWSTTGNNMFCRENGSTSVRRIDGTETSFSNTSSSISTTEYQLGRIYTVGTSYMFEHSGFYRYYGFGSGMDATKRAAFDTILTNFNNNLYSTMPSYSSEATSLFARMSSQPTTALKDLINVTIYNLKTTGLWDLDDLRYFFNLHTEQASGLNWKGNNYNITAYNAPTWAAKVGYTNGAGKWLGTNYNFNTNGVKFTLNNAGFGIGIATFVDEYKVDLGYGWGSNGCAFMVKYAGYMYTELNGAQFTPTHSNAEGIYDGCRTGNVLNYYFNGSTKIVDNMAQTAAGSIINGECLIGRYYGSMGYESTKTFNYVRIGADLSSSQALMNYNILYDFNNCVGRTF